MPIDINYLMRLVRNPHPFDHPDWIFELLCDQPQVAPRPSTRRVFNLREANAVFGPVTQFQMLYD